MSLLTLGVFRAVAGQLEFTFTLMMEALSAFETTVNVQSCLLGYTAV
jgi:hypothetical protein